MSLAYASADGPSGKITAALADGHGTAATIRTVQLIRLGRDQRLYQWETIETLPLGGTA